MKRGKGALEQNFLHSNFEENLIDIKSIIDRNINASDSNVKRLLNTINASGGKHLRAIFVLIGGSFGNIDRQKLNNIAAAVELLHLATLVHDDIVDDSDIRRGCETINKNFGIKTALFTGDYLFAESYVMFSKNASSSSIQLVSQTIKTVCRGEITQFFTSCSFRSTLKSYLRRIEGKCACLFSLSLSIGAFDGASDLRTAAILKRIGHYVGMAFQIIDDILDITLSKEALGKPAGNDIRQGIYTLPVIFEVNSGNSYLETLIEKGDIDEALLLLRHCAGLEKTRILARLYTSKALKLINELPDKVEKQILADIVEMMLVREY